MTIINTINIFYGCKNDKPSNITFTSVKAMWDCNCKDIFLYTRLYIIFGKASLTWKKYI